MLLGGSDEVDMVLGSSDEVGVLLGCSTTTVGGEILLNSPFRVDVVWT